MKPQTCLISMLTCVVVVVVSVLLAVLLVPREWSVKSGSAQGPYVRLLSRHELSLHDGQQGSKGLYLAIMGQVFDVNKGHKHYGPGGAYHFMAGRDSSLSFITGDFTESGLTDDVSSLSPVQVVALYDWLAFYQRDYQTVGLVTGRFYSETGQPTEALLQVEASLVEGQRMKAQSEAEKLHFPSCNSEWSSARGGRVWCSTKSGGVVRDWTGVPRKLFSAGSTGVRCVCVEDPSAAEEDPNLQKYEGCPPQAESCAVGEF
ncbi:neuferricin [Hippoglossus stenolepis]|uniref:neuferricin n=1 Tax=Hippoglossus stenolepis TaxID=195615 RepID=UPI00159C2DF0|nr:neuferricin [Hippoglossus stenolepis]